MSIIFSLFNFTTKIFLILPILFIWINFYLKNLVFSLVTSSILTILIIILLNLINRNKKEKKQLKFKQSESCKRLSLNLLMSNNNTILNFFKNLYQDVVIESQLNCLTLKHNESEKIEYIFPIFNKQCVLLDDILLIIKVLNEIIIKDDNNNLTIKIICNDYDKKNIVNFLYSINLNIQLEKIEDIYLEKNLENYNFKFSGLIKEKNKTKLTKILFSSLNKKNAKKFAYAGFTMMIFSFFTFYNIYYSIFSSVLFLTALYSFSNKKYN